MKFKSLLYSAIAGNILEFYDLGLFGFLAPVINHIFFPGNSALRSLLTTFGMYTIGFLARPLGAIIFGYLGDRYGRKIGLTYSISTMAIPTAIIAGLPGYSVIGIFSPLILLLCRFIQGMCTGGEYNGSAIFFLEHNGIKYSGRYSSILSAAALFGFLLSAFVALIAIQKVMPEWAWRCAFLLGSAIAILGSYIRKHLVETPEYLLILQQRSLCNMPIKMILQKYRLASACTIGIGWCVGCASLTIMGMPAFMCKIVGIPMQMAYITNVIAIIVYIICTLLAGYMADQYSPHKVMLCAAINLILCAYPIYALLNTKITIYVLLGQLLLALVASGLAGPFHAVMLSLFPPAIRYTGISFNFSLGIALFGGSAPLLTSLLAYYSKHTTFASLYLVGSGIVGVISLIIIIYKNLAIYKPKNINSKETLLF